MATTVTIKRPAHDVFDHLVQLHDAEWRDGVEAMRLESEDPHGLGARHTEVRRIGRRTIETLAEAVVYEPDRCWAVQRATGPVRPRVTYELASVDSGTTTLRFRFALGQLSGAGKLLWPIGKAVSPIVERAARKDLARLAEQLQSVNASE